MPRRPRHCSMPLDDSPPPSTICSRSSTTARWTISTRGAWLPSGRTSRRSGTGCPVSIISRFAQGWIAMFRAVCQRDMGRVLADALHISPAHAARRVRAAEHLSERSTLCGQPLPPLRRHLAEAQRRGDVTPDQVMIIIQALREVDGRGFYPADIDAGEQILVDVAVSLKPAELRDVATKVIDAIDPDRTLPSDQLQRDRRYLHIRRAADGSFRGDFRLTPEAGARLKAVLDPLARPESTALQLSKESADDQQDPTGTVSADALAGIDSRGTAETRRLVEPDLRTRGQRMHDALEMVCSRLLRSGTVPDSGGTPATVVITIDADALRARTGIGFLTDGSPVSAATVIDLADQADVAWCVKHSRSGARARQGSPARLSQPDAVTDRPRRRVLLSRLRHAS